MKKLRTVGDLLNYLEDRNPNDILLVENHEGEYHELHGVWEGKFDEKLRIVFSKTEGNQGKNCLVFQ